MFTTLVHVRIADADRFLEVFSSRGMEARRAHGSLGASAYLKAEDVTTAILIIDWNHQSDFEGFLADPAVRDTMRSGGALDAPVFTFMNRIGVLPA